jgi:hypothetical protein
VRVIRGLAAVVLTLAGLWCLFWLDLFVALTFVLKSDNPLSSFVVLAAWVAVFLGAAYLVQPWWQYFWRRAAGT